jgi:membrane dipeptidase
MKAAVLVLALVAGCGQGRASPSGGGPVASVAAAPISAPSGSVASGGTLEERAKRLHEDAIIVDGHNDITTAILTTGFDLAKPNGKTHTDLPRMRAGGITGEFFSIYVDRVFAEKPTPHGGGSARRALDMIDVVYQQIERHPDALILATSVDDIRRAKREGKVACLLGIEGGHAIEDSLFALREFYRLGVRYMTLTHTNNNDWADSAGFAGPQPAPHHGLSPFGEEVVREMQRIGMLVDVSHVSDKTFFDVMEIAKTPVIASHSSARAVADHRRNLTDDMLRALAKNGGVAMVNFWPAFIDPAYMSALATFMKKHAPEVQALRQRFKDDHRGFAEALDKIKAADGSLPLTPIAVLIDHIEHMVKIAGIDHVGLGSDFDGVDSLPEGVSGIDQLPNITLELLKRGHSEEEVRKILGLNFLRVFEAAEAYRAATKTTLSGDGSTTAIDAAK